MNDHLIQFLLSVGLAFVTAVITVGSVRLQGLAGASKPRPTPTAHAGGRAPRDSGHRRLRPELRSVAPEDAQVVSRARHDLDRVYERFEEQPGVKLGEQEPTSFAHSFRHFLVRDRVVGGPAAVARGFFYASFAWVLFCAFVLVAEILDGTLDTSTRVTAPLFVGVVALLPVFALRLLTIRLLNREERERPWSSAPMSTSQHRLGSRPGALPCQCLLSSAARPAGQHPGGQRPSGVAGT